MDWNAVTDLASQYEAAGLANTRSGNFLKSISQSREVRGGGVSWLDSLIENGDPRPNVALANELAAIQDISPGDSRYLFGIINRLREGRKPQAWELECIERVKNHSTIPSVPVSDHQLSVLRALDIYLNGDTNWYYWRKREGVLRKGRDIVAQGILKGTLTQDDWEWVKDKFKGIVSGVETSAGEEGQIRFWHSPAGWKTVMVMGNGYYHREWAGIVQDCMFDGQITPIRIDKLRKRMPKEA
jgi:hypothetical protein